MLKRGQVTAFAIIGILVVGVILLLFFYRGELIDKLSMFGDDQKQLEVKMEGIVQHIGECMEEESILALNLLADNGGVFEPSNVIVYHGIGYRVLVEKNGASHPIVLSSISELFNLEMESRLKKCIMLDAFVDLDMLSVGSEFEVNTEINDDNVKVELYKPITLKKGESERKVENFVKIVNVPLREIIGVVNDVVNTEASGFDFDPLAYGVASMGYKNVIVKKPYPNKIYFVDLEDSDYEFKFAIEGVSRFE